LYNSGWFSYSSIIIFLTTSLENDDISEALGGVQFGDAVGFDLGDCIRFA
jgi:hypothetical protein